MSPSSRTTAVYLVLIVCIASLPKTTHCFDFEEWLRSRINTAKPKDCTFSNWSPWQSCTQSASGKIQHSRTRNMFQPKNNGKACPPNPNLNEVADCSDTETIADKFIEVMHSTGPAPADNRDRNQCLSDLYQLRDCELQHEGVKVAYLRLLRFRYATDSLKPAPAIHPAWNRTTIAHCEVYRWTYLRKEICAAAGINPKVSITYDEMACLRRLFWRDQRLECLDESGSYYVTYHPGSNQVCREYKDKQGNTIMAGGQCGSSSRRKRSAESIAEKQRVKRDDTKTEKAWDLVFLLDESGSVGKDRFEDIILYLATGITKTLCRSKAVKEDQTMIGVASFDEYNHEHILLDNKYTDDVVKLIDAIRKIEYNSSSAGQTCLASALRFCKDHMFHPLRGARTKDQAEQMIILITDGCANCATDDLNSAASDLYDEGISLLTLVIGNDQDCIQTMKELDDPISKCWKIAAPQTWEQAKQVGEAFWARECNITAVDSGKANPTCY